MHYDPIKLMLGRIFNRWLFSRRLFYFLLDILLLRTWHIHHELKGFFRLHRTKNDMKVLDAGCGFGQYTYFIARRNPDWKITGIDIKEEEIVSCRQFFERSHIKNVDFQVADLTALRHDPVYSLIVSVDVMEHIVDDRAVFRNFFQALKPGGMLLINTPSDQGGSGVSSDQDVSFIGEHVRDGYSMEEMRKKLTEAGFENMEMKYTYGWPGNVSWHISMKYPIFMLGFSRLFMIILPIYYLLVMPVALVLNFLDLHTKHQRGTGLVVKTWKDFNH